MAQSPKNAQPDVEAATFPSYTSEENWHKGNSGEWWWTAIIIRRMMMNRRNHRRLLEIRDQPEQLLENRRMNRQIHRILLASGINSTKSRKTGEWTAKIVEYHWSSHTHCVITTRISLWANHKNSRPAKSYTQDSRRKSTLILAHRRPLLEQKTSRSLKRITRLHYLPRSHHYHIWSQRSRNYNPRPKGQSLHSFAWVSFAKKVKQGEKISSHQEYWTRD